MSADGHIRLRNRLCEAVISAPFHGMQYKIVLAVIRQTIGWQRQAVSISLSDLAVLCDCSPVGGFRRALKELVAEGVLHLVVEGGGATANAYALQADFERWGKFSQATRKLESLWGRPDHESQLPLQILTVTPGGRSEAPSGSKEPHPVGSSTPPATDAEPAGSSVGKKLKDRKDNYRGGRGEAMELLTAIEALREHGAEGDARSKTFIRRDRIRSELGVDVEEALKLIGGTDRLLKTKAEHRGILIANFAEALDRVRRRPRVANA